MNSKSFEEAKESLGGPSSIRLTAEASRKQGEICGDAVKLQLEESGRHKKQAGGVAECAAGSCNMMSRSDSGAGASERASDVGAGWQQTGSAKLSLGTSSTSCLGPSTNPSYSQRESAYILGRRSNHLVLPPTRQSVSSVAAVSLDVVSKRVLQCATTMTHDAIPTTAAAPNKRSSLLSAKWYQTSFARRLRRGLRSRPFELLSMIAIMLALFLADIFVVCQVPSNTELDILLVMVFAVFLVEWLGFAASDPTYPFSFFFWMDTVGAASMILDVSFLMGKDATMPVVEDPSENHNTVIVARAARAAKQAARAGRITRTLKLLRFVPSLRVRTDQKTQVAKLISDQLNGLLATRIAFLSIILMIGIPLFSLWLFPQMDDSMGAWVQLLSHDTLAFYMNRNAQSPWLQEQLGSFSSFYLERGDQYGPFEACIRETSTAAFACDLTVLGVTWHTPYASPRRKASVHVLVDQNFKASFDFSTLDRYESLMNIAAIVFVIVFMSGFTMLTSASVGAAVIVPLERMLGQVRSNCAQIWRYTSEVHRAQVTQPSEKLESHSMWSMSEAGQRMERYAECANEFILLEKVIAKLGTLVQLITARRGPSLREPMTEDDLLVLNFMQQGYTAGVNTKSWMLEPSSTPKSNKSGEARPSQLRSKTMDEIMTSVDSNTFDALIVPANLKASVAARTLMSMPFSSTLSRTRVCSFMTAVEGTYLPNPYHNFSHALDVLHTVRRFLSQIEANVFLPELTQLWLMVAAVGHDVAHPGVNNPYLVECAHPYALLYNDKSPLENLHCATLFQIIQDSEANVFSNLDANIYKQVRKGVVSCILATDMLGHHDMIKDLGMLYELNPMAFGRHGSRGEVAVVMQEPTNAQLIVNAMLHFADTSNPLKPWNLCYKWAQLCLDEFFAQGDLEKAAGLPVQMLNDRDKVNRPHSQFGFIEFAILPMAEKMVPLFQELAFCAEALGTNVKLWEATWIRESDPPPEEVAKVRTRVAKVVDSCIALAKPLAPPTPRSERTSRRSSQAPITPRRSVN